VRGRGLRKNCPQESQRWKSYCAIEEIIRNYKAGKRKAVKVCSLRIETPRGAKSRDKKRMMMKNEKIRKKVEGNTLQHTEKKLERMRSAHGISGENRRASAAFFEKAEHSSIQKHKESPPAENMKEGKQMRRE